MMRPAVPAPVLVPTLDALAQDPSIAVSLPRDAAVSLYMRCAITEAALRARLLGDPAPASSPPPSPSGPEWITAAQVREQFGLDSAWLAEHRRELQARRIVSAVSRKVRLYSVPRLRRLIEQQAESVR